MKMDELGNAVDSLDVLLRGEGWGLVVEHLKRRQASALQAMSLAKDSFELQKHTQTYIAYGDILKEPEMLRSSLSQQLNRQLTQK